MTVQLCTSTKQFIGLSTDTKPAASSSSGVKSITGIGCTFYELDTGYRFIWNGENWVEDLSMMVAVRDALGELS